MTGPDQSSGVAVDAWSPPEGWDTALRRRWRRVVASVVFDLLFLAFFVCAAIVRVDWLLPALWSATAVAWLWRDSRPVRHPGARAGWEDDAREEIRIAHALRHHADAGGGFREIVTDRADRIATWAPTVLVLWLVVAVVACAVAALQDDLLVRLAAAAVAAGAVVGLLSSQRRGARAVRWLADPLPRS